MSHIQYFNLSIRAPIRLEMMRKDFAAHSAKYPYCPESAKPKKLFDIRGTTLAKCGAYFSHGINQGSTEWYSHGCDNFRDDREVKDSGWYTESSMHDTANGIIARLPHGRFIAGYTWTNNGERVYFPDIFTDESDAEKAADEHARVFAESSQEDSQRFETMCDAENEQDSAQTACKLAVMARNVSPEHRELAREAIDAYREAIEKLETATRDYER